jgi:hypothetical protein
MVGTPEAASGSRLSEEYMKLTSGFHLPLLVVHGCGQFSTRSQDGGQELHH